MTKVALLIGVSEYEPGLNPLSAAVKDVAAMQRVLLDPEMGGFDQVKPLTNPDPQVMQYEIETLFSGRDKDDLVLLFFSGHGIKDDSGRLYFASRITRKNNKGDLIRSTAVPTSFVHDIMNNSRCRRQAIILDCCFSGAFDPSLQAKDDGSVDLRSQLGAEGRVVLTSSSSTEYSFEQQGADLSLYTRYLVEGIETGAGDRNEDGFVSMLELHDYAASKVRETAPKMTPKIIVLKDKGFEIVLSKARVTDPKLRYRKAASRSANAGSIRPSDRAYLNVLRQQLGLTPEEAIAIETEVLRPYQERLTNLENYREAVIAEAELEYPLSKEAREGINRLQELLGLRDVDVLPIQQKIEAQFFQKLEAHQQHLTQYEQAFTEAIQREFPFSQQSRQDLENLQQSLELRHEDTTRVEQPLFQQAELRHQEKLRQIAEQQRQEQERAEYENKLRRYEQDFSKAVQAEYPLSQAVLNGLNSFQQQLELKDEDVIRIEQPIREPVEAKYQEKLRQQEEAKQQQQAELEKRRKVEYVDRLRRYEQEFSKAIQAEYPLDQPVIDKLKNFQQRLELKVEDVTQIEQPIYKLAEAEHHNKLKQQEEAEQQRQKQERAEYENKLRRYEQELSKAIQVEYPLSEYIHEGLKNFQQFLGLAKPDIERIEKSIIEPKETEYQRQQAEKRSQNDYQLNLKRYERELVKVIQAEYPLSKHIREELKTLQQSLGIKDKDINQIEQSICGAAEAQYQEKLKQKKLKTEAAAHVLEGIHYFDQGWLDESVAEYRKAAQLDPNNAAIYYQLGSILEEQNKFDEVIVEYQKSAKIDPSSASVWLSVALDLKGQYEKEVAEARATIAQNSYDADAYAKLASGLSSLGKFQEAYAVYQRAAFLNPEKNYHICLAQLLEHLNKPEAAVVEYRKKFDKEEEVSLILVRHFANALGNAGNYEEAIKHYQEYLGYDRDDGLFHHNLGLALYKFKKLEEAIVEFQIAVQLDPTERRFQKSLEAAIQERSNPNLRINNKKSLLGCRFVDSLVNSATLDITQIFGDVQHQEELKQQAKAEQQRGKQKQTENEQKQRSITENKGNFDITLELPLTANEMQTGVDKQVILDDGTVTIKVPSGITQGKLIRIRSKGKFNSDTQERGNLYLKIVKTSIATPANSAYEASTEAFLHGLSGDALRKEGKLEEAITEYRKAIQVNPNNGTNYHSLGIALYEQGKLEEAITEYRKAIQLGPISNTGSLNGYDNSGVAITHYSLGIALYKQGKLEEAIAEYRKAIQINPYLTVAREGLETALKAQK